MRDQDLLCASAETARSLELDVISQNIEFHAVRGYASRSLPLHESFLSLIDIWVFFFCVCDSFVTLIQSSVIFPFAFIRF